MTVTLSRRSFVRLGLAASAALALSGCAGQDNASRSSDAGSGSSGAGHAPAAKQSRDAKEVESPMEPPLTVTLNSGYEMPTQGLGTYALDYTTCVGSIQALAAAGGRLIDTAYMYHNEDAVGEGVRTCGVPREELFVTTKLYPSQFAEPDAAIDQALEKLGVGYLDLMLLHHPGTGDVEAYRAMERAVAAGKIRSLGLSNWYIDELESFLPQVETVPALVQNEIHPYYQERDVVPYIQDLGIVAEGWNPLGGRGHNSELLADPVLTSIAQAHGVSVPQVILRWNRQRGIVVIPGSSNPAHIAEDLDIRGFSLTEEEMARIAALDRAEKHDWY